MIELLGWLFVLLWVVRDFRRPPRELQRQIDARAERLDALQVDELRRELRDDLLTGPRTAWAPALESARRRYEEIQHLLEALGRRRAKVLRLHASGFYGDAYSEDALSARRSDLELIEVQESRLRRELEQLVSPGMVRLVRNRELRAHELEGRPGEVIQILPRRDLEYIERSRREPVEPQWPEG